VGETGEVRFLLILETERKEKGREEMVGLGGERRRGEGRESEVDFWKGAVPEDQNFES